MYFNYIIVVVNAKFMFDMGTLLYFKTVSFSQVLFSYISATLETESVINNKYLLPCILFIR